MPNSLYTYISNTYMISKHILLIAFLNELEFFFVFFGTQLNSFIHFYLIRIILTTIKHFLAHS